MCETECRTSVPFGGARTAARPITSIMLDRDMLLPASVLMHFGTVVRGLPVRAQRHPLHPPDTRPALSRSNGAHLFSQMPHCFPTTLLAAPLEGCAPLPFAARARVFERSRRLLSGVDGAPPSLTRRVCVYKLANGKNIKRSFYSLVSCVVVVVVVVAAVRRRTTPRYSEWTRASTGSWRPCGAE